jgi:hypothetical protein
MFVLFGLPDVPFVANAAKVRLDLETPAPPGFVRMGCVERNG